MEEIMTVFNRFGLLIAVVGGGISLVMFGFAGVQYMMAQGDPQAMGRAKGAFIGALVGSAIVGLAFIIPGIISRVIIEPSGGAALEVDTGDDCDQLLRNQLKFQRAASTAGRMNEVIRQIQNQRDSCLVELWNPNVEDADAGTLVSCDHDMDPMTADQPDIGCSGSTGASHPTCGAGGVVGNTQVPAGLRSGNEITGTVRVTSGRDSSNNMIVYWHSTDAAQRPADSSMCWLYVSRLNSWDESY